MHDNWIQNRVVPLEPRYSWKTKFIIKIPKNLIKTKMPSLLAPWKTFSLLILKHLHSDEFGLNSVNIKENFGRPEVSINTPK